MKITMLTVGTRGEVEPLVALGLGLQAAGHSVRIATHAQFEDFVRHAGLDFCLIDIDLRAILKSSSFEDTVKGKRNPVEAWKNPTGVKSVSWVWQILADGMRASQGADAVLYTLGALAAAPHIAEKLCIPAIGAFPYPVGQPTRAFPNVLMAPGKNFGSILNRFTHRMFDMFFWIPIRGVVNEWRSKQAGLPPCGLNFLQQFHRQRQPMLYGFSPSVVTRPPDWGDQVYITGYWFLDAEIDWQPPPALIQFLESGPRPVYVGFGSIGTHNPRETAALVFQALARTRQRAILLAGDGDLNGMELPENIFKIAPVPFEWLFPKMAALVHHGGSGTTALGLRAGVPTITVPSFMDQPYWGHRVAALGVGPAPIPLKSLDASNLEQALNRVLHDQDMQSRASELGKRIRAEDGVANAVRAITEYQRHGSWLTPPASDL